MRRALCLCAVIMLLMKMPLSGRRTPVQASTAGGVPVGKWILIEIDLKRLTLYEGTRPIKCYPIATGAYDTPSPIGVFTVTGRFRTEMSGFGTRFLRLDVPYGMYGIHGTNKPESIGSNASHGCFRLQVRDAEELYELTPNGVKVYIEGGPYGPLGDGLRTLVPGDRGSHVAEVQRRLKLNGFYAGAIDGIYGAGMTKAVLSAREAYRLNAADRVDGALLQRLGVVLFE